MRAQVSEFKRVRCQATREALWPLISNTDRLNQIAGLPAVQIQPSTRGPARFRVVTKLGPLEVEWAELPWQWEAPQWLSVRREPERGPLERFEFSMRLEAVRPGAEVTVAVEAQVKHRRWVPVMRRVARRAVDSLSQAVATLDRSLVHPAAEPVTGVDESALTHGLSRLKAELPNVAPDCIDRLARVIRTGADHEVARIRPYEWADRWQVRPRLALEICLAAVVVGLFELSWDVICPSCRTAATRLPDLSQLGETGHCTMCDLTYELSLDQAVEASFRPHPSVREIPDIQFCTGGPAATPHVVSQAVLWAHQVVRLGVPDTPGRYRVFGRGGAMVQIAVGPEHPERLQLTLKEGFQDGPARVAPHGTIEVQEGLGVSRHVKLEHLQWASQAATALDVSTSGLYRRFLSTQALKPGLSMKVGRVTFLFSDLSASTALYTQQGDAAAFRLVQDHFELLFRLIETHDGAVVKTIGDAVMASFTKDQNALDAALALQEAFVGFRAAHPEAEAVYLKIGVYGGPCFAVEANGQLDYFGQTVNIAARLQGQAEDAEVVVPAAFVNEEAFVRTASSVFDVVERFVPTLKGVTEPIPAVRLKGRPTAG